MLKPFFKILVELTGNKYTSKILEAFAKSRFSSLLNPLFVKAYKINKNEMEHGMSSYKSLHELFTRRLKPDARKIELDNHSLISPVDGSISSFGKISGEIRFQVKNTELHLDEMLGSKEIATKYQNGHYIIFYLSPQNYHRIHSPIDGEIHNQWTLGGKSYPVNKLGLKYGKRPLSTNFRRITEIRSEHGDIGIVKVGALNVNSIHLLHQTSQIQVGDDLAYFSFGSTVVLLIEDENFQFADTIKEEAPILYGQKIGHF